jgi:hypothetical protein
MNGLMALVLALAIRSNEGGYPEPTGTVSITQNGTANVKDYASAAVNVQPVLQQKTATENGTVTPDSGYDGLSSVTVDVSGGGDATYISKEDGTIGAEIGPGKYKVYFNGFAKSANDVTIVNALGTSDSNYRELYALLESVQYMYSDSLVMSKAYGPDKTTQIGWIGLYSYKIRSWTMDKGSTLSGTFWGVLDITSDSVEQHNDYSDPPAANNGVNENNGQE